MGISLISELEPKNSGSFALLDDKYLRGGLRVIETVDELRSIPTDRLKDGCLSMVTTPSRVLYVYDKNLDTWEPFSSGGGGGGSDWLCVEDGETTKLIKDVDTWTQKVVVINHIRTYSDYFALPTEYVQNNEVAYCKADVMEGTTTYKKGLYSYDIEKTSWVEVNSTIEIDSALSDTSKRPVQNRVVTRALEEKVSKDDVDNVISRFSENPIQNKAVATALENIKNSKTMTAEEYDALDDETKNDGSFYYISDTGEIYQNGIIYGGKQIFDVTQEEYDALTDEEKSNNEYHCTDTGRTYINGILYGDKKPIELTYEEYKQLEADGLVEPDVDYIIVGNESGVLLTSTDVAYSDTLTVKEKFDEVDEAIDEKADKTELNTKLDKEFITGVTDANDAIGEKGVNIFVMSASSANMPISRTGIIRSYTTIEDKYIRVNQEFSTIDNSPQNGGTYKRYGSSDDGGVTYAWSGWNFVASIDDSSTALLKTWSSRKIVDYLNSPYYTGLINAYKTVDTGWSLEQRESRRFGRLLQLDGHEGNDNMSYSFIIFVKANHSNATEVVCKQIVGMYQDYDAVYTKYFTLGISDNKTLTITSKSGVQASYRFI